MFQLSRISLLMFGKKRLYLIVKGMRVFICVPFCYHLLPCSYQVSQLL